MIWFSAKKVLLSPGIYCCTKPGVRKLVGTSLEAKCMCKPGGACTCSPNANCASDAIQVQIMQARWGKSNTKMLILFDFYQKSPNISKFNFELLNTISRNLHRHFPQNRACRKCREMREMSGNVRKCREMSGNVGSASGGGPSLTINWTGHIKLMQLV